MQRACILAFENGHTFGADASRCRGVSNQGLLPAYPCAFSGPVIPRPGFIATELGNCSNPYALTIIVINFFIFYHAGISSRLCGLLSIAFLAAPEALHYAFQARFEIYQTLFIMLFFVFIQQGLKTSKCRTSICRGLILGRRGLFVLSVFSIGLFCTFVRCPI